MSTNTSTKVANNTGAAKDDAFASPITGLTEDNRVASLNVLVNDPGAARLYSLTQNMSASSAAAFPVADHGSSVLGATVSMNADGTVKYDASTVNVEYLAAGQKITDTFTYTVQMANGAVSTASVTVELAGRNDGPVITNAAAASHGSVTEDTALIASGQLSASDLDSGATQSWGIVGSAAGTYGALALDAATGQWTYSLDNAANQALAAGESHTDTFTVRVTDDQGAFVDQVVSVDIAGTNDAASISGTSTGAVTEDTTLAASGTLSVADADHGQAAFQAQTGAAGTYGTFSIGANGNWTYALNNDAAAVQALNTSDHVSDSFSVLSQDGSASELVTIKVDGLDDNAAPVAVDDLVIGSVMQVVTALTFENGTYTQDYGYYNPNTGIYSTTVATGGFNLTSDVNANNNSGSGPYVTGWWGADYTNAVYSYGYNYNGSPATTQAIAMTRADGASFSLVSANITSYADYYNSGQSEYETVTGYAHGVQVAQQSFYVPDANSGTHNNLVAFSDPGFASVDKVVFSLTNSGGNNYSNNAYQWIDNIGMDASAVAAQTEDRAVDISVLANDTDRDAGDTLSVAGFAALSAQGAAITLNADGTLRYDATHAANAQALALGETFTDTFTYTAQDQHGALSNTATVSVVLHGANDAAGIGGVRTGSVAEDGTLQATGQLVVSDVDHGQAHVLAQNNVAGSYGSFSIAADGNWTYALNNGAANVQSLAASQQVSDSFTVTSADGTATEQVVVTVAGANDAPVAANDAISGAFLTFEQGTYTESQVYNANTGNYAYTVSSGDFNFDFVNGGGVTGWWGSDNTNAIYSYGYNNNGVFSTTSPISMTRTDGASFSLESANVTGLSYNNQSEYETVTGYSHGVQVAQQSFLVPNADYGTHNNVLTLTDPGFGAVDKVVFSLSTSNGYYNYAYQWIDNISTPNTVMQSRDINVLLNDSDVDAIAHLSVGSFSALSAHGAAISLNADGTLHYDPTVSAELQALSQGSNVYDSFSYRAQDDLGALSDTATVYIGVVGVAHA